MKYEKFPKNQLTDKLRKAIFVRCQTIIETDRAEASLCDLSLRSLIYSERHAWVSVYSVDAIEIDLEDWNVMGEWDNAISRVQASSEEECVSIVVNWLCEQ